MMGLVFDLIVGIDVLAISGLLGRLFENAFESRKSQMLAERFSMNQLPVTTSSSAAVVIGAGWR